MAIGIFTILTGITCRNILATNQRPIPAPSKVDIFSSRKGDVNCSVSEGDTTIGSPYSFEEEAAICLPCSSNREATTCSHSLHGFTTSFADVDTEQLNTQICFDTDSVFFVCDNSTTGNICNDIQRFIPGCLHQTNQSLTTANGTGSCLQEGMVRLSLIDDNGTKHTFILDNCLNHPDSSVNLLSTRRLAEKFIDGSRNLDEETRIKSCYSTHVLIWSFG